MTTLFAIFLMILCSVLIAVAQLFFKRSSASLSLRQPWDLLKNRWILAGFGIYFLILYLTSVAYQYGDLMVLFPLTNLTLVWNILLARRYLGEEMTRSKVLGTALIIAGCLAINF